MNFLLTLFLGASFFFGPSENSTGKLRIKIEGLDVREGIIGLMVFNKEDGFPTEKEKAYLWREYQVDESLSYIEIDDLPLGKYAVSIVHDVNGNKDLDKNMFGIPTEPFGFSGNKSILFGLPKFEEAVIELNAQEVESAIKLIDLL